MAVFTFVCRHEDGTWSAKQQSGDLEGSADSAFELQRHLSKLAFSSAGSGGISSSFSYITPSAAVFQVIVGGGGGGSFIGGGGGAGAVPAAAGGGAAPAVEEKKEEEKKEEEESDDDMGFSLFD
ncbi:hypothetical protein GOP47_0009249 [Adiantum capillus-veneris]|uniref:60S acidic ribosomal protein P3 n=1 Tax=Adiantum capillus-veneris TaxID=13818 RepID=A0A9D4ZH11_ADICA|nr:hypothetical protein GOP47_0009249 [Adiantum capillus-veneris]